MTYHCSRVNMCGHCLRKTDPSKNCEELYFGKGTFQHLMSFYSVYILAPIGRGQMLTMHQIQHHFFYTLQ